MPTSESPDVIVPGSQKCQICARDQAVLACRQCQRKLCNLHFCDICRHCTRHCKCWGRMGKVYRPEEVSSN